MNSIINIEKPLKQEDIETFEKSGYFVVENAITKSLAYDLADVMLKYQKACEKKLNKSLEDYPGGIVKLVHHPLQWKLRESPIIYLAFCQLLNESKLWVSLDRGKIVPPVSFNGILQKGFIHWDINTNQIPSPLPLQGLVALTDAHVNEGGFQCIPGFHEKFHEWKKTQPMNRDPFHPNLEGLKVVPVSMKAGDLVIWNSLLPHGNALNLANTPRIAQLIRMFPCEFYKKDILKKRLEMWKYKLPYNELPSDDSQWEEPKLSFLGERLLGISGW